MSKKEYLLYIQKEIHRSFFVRFIKIVTNNSCKAIYMIRRAQYLYDKTFLGHLISKRYIYKLGKIYGIFISPKQKIGIGLRLPHPNGIIIGEAVEIGENCAIYQQVTIGSAHVGDLKKGLQPKIGNSCVLFAGCKVIGDISLADKTIIGANAVCNKSTEKDGVYVGIPAKKILKQ